MNLNYEANPKEYRSSSTKTKIFTSGRSSFYSHFFRWRWLHKCANSKKKKDYVLKFQIRVTITFFQKTKRVHILDQIEELLGCGVRRSKDYDGVSELTIAGVDLVEPILTLLQPFFRLKSQQAKLVLKI